MKEIRLPRPDVHVGELDWKNKSEIVFVLAYAMALKANRGGTEKTAYYMMCSAMSKEAVLMSAMHMVESQCEYLSRNGEDNVHSWSRLKENHRKLNALVEQRGGLENQRRSMTEHNKELRTALEEADRDFFALLSTIEPGWEEQELMIKASLITDAIKLIDFYLEEEPPCRNS